MLPPDPKDAEKPEAPDDDVVVFDEEEFNHEDYIEISRSVLDGDKRWQGDGQRKRPRRVLRLFAKRG